MKRKVKLWEIFWGKGGVLVKTIFRHRKIFLKIILIMAMGIFLFSGPIWAEQIGQIGNEFRSKSPKTPGLNTTAINTNLAPLKTKGWATSIRLQPISIQPQLGRIAAPLRINSPGTRISAPSRPLSSNIRLNAPATPKLGDSIPVSRINNPTVIRAATLNQRWATLRKTSALNTTRLNVNSASLKVREGFRALGTIAPPARMAAPANTTSPRVSSRLNTMATPQIRTAAPATPQKINSPTTRLTPRLAPPNLKGGSSHTRTPALNATRIANNPAPRIIATPQRTSPAAIPLRSNRNFAPTSRINTTNINTTNQERTILNVERNISARTPSLNITRTGKNLGSPKVNQTGQLQSINLRSASTIIGSTGGITFSNSGRYSPPRTPANESNIPLSPSRQPQPVSLPVLPSIPNNTPSQTGGTGTGGSSNSHSSSNNHSRNSSGNPLTAPLIFPLILGLCGQLPTSFRKRFSRIISEVSRRQKNGIGFILAPRAPNIIQVDECSLAFVHQMRKEENPRLAFLHHNHPILNPRLNSAHSICLNNNKIISSGRISNLNKNILGIKDRFFRSQDNCGLFYFLVRKDGR